MYFVIDLQVRYHGAATESMRAMPLNIREFVTREGRHQRNSESAPAESIAHWENEYAQAAAVTGYYQVDKEGGTENVVHRPVGLDESVTSPILTFPLDGEGTGPPLPTGEGWGEGEVVGINFSRSQYWSLSQNHSCHSK